MEKQTLSLMELGKMLHAVYRVYKKRSDAMKHAAVRISTEQIGLLHAISVKEEDVIQKDMAEMMGKDKSAILRLIDTLEEKELVRRVVDTKDRRKNYLMVTKAGYRAIEQHLKIVKELMEDLQKGLTAADIKTFQKVVSQIKNNTEKL
jgi:MarR family transcriptional regulator, transcriptional regulator for hemolysin